ncbi:MAG TPA: kynureninase [Stellaceae bacterium]|nr:kynureninase [Stellaceae bacterium]
MTRDEALALDRADTLAAFRSRFVLPADIIYLDGNSLGALPKATPARLAAVIENEWGEGLIRSWNRHGWIDLPRRVGDKIGRLIGARPGEVVVADSTSVNLFKLIAAALRLRPERRVIVSESENFPTDLYVAQGLIELLGNRHELRLVTPQTLDAALDDDVALVLLTHVNYRSGRMHDMAAVTRRAHAAGALMLWDLAHSAGALQVDLNGCDADLAVGCGYKYLNGGPGAPAFLYVVQRLQEDFRSPLTGWLGHAAPFDFDWRYRPAPGIASAIVGTPPILSLAALEIGIDLALEADLAAVRAKSLALARLFAARVSESCAGFGLTLASPSRDDERGSQICYAHPEGYAIMQALIARGVIGDFRAPDILRFGFTPLYTGFADVFDAVEILREVLASGEWDRPEFKRRAAVT